MEGLRTVLRDPGVAIVEDAAQAMGEASEGGKLGALGDVGFFSLGRGKALSCMEGGVILTNRDDIAEGLRDILPRLPLRAGVVADPDSQDGGAHAAHSPVALLAAAQPTVPQVGRDAL